MFLVLIHYCDKFAKCLVERVWPSSSEVIIASISHSSSISESAQVIWDDVEIEVRYRRRHPEGSTLFCKHLHKLAKAKSSGTRPAGDSRISLGTVSIVPFEVIPRRGNRETVFLPSGIGSVSGLVFI